MVYTNQTEKFPFQSSKGHRYLMIMMKKGENHVYAEPLKNKTEGEMIRSYLVLHERVKSSGVCNLKNMSWIMKHQKSSKR